MAVDPKARQAIYDKLAQEGGGTWATYMMMEIDALAALPSTAGEPVAAVGIVEISPEGRSSFERIITSPSLTPGKHKVYAAPPPAEANPSVAEGWHDVAYLMSIIDSAIEDGFDPDEDWPLLDQIRAGLKPTLPQPSPVGRDAVEGELLAMALRIDNDGTPSQIVGADELRALASRLASPLQSSRDEVIEPEAWMGYWPGAGSTDSVTRTTHVERIADAWAKDGAEITPLAAIRSIKEGEAK